MFNETLLASDSVILFRSSPSQKAQMVSLIKNHQKEKKLTLAIGDGFNDVNMIQEAHVGVGIRSVESNQAAAFADFSIMEFKDLRRLMFWHGRSQGHKSIFFIIMKLYVSFSQVVALLAN